MRIHHRCLIALALIVPGAASLANSDGEKGKSYNQFIVEFQPGTTARGNAAARQRLLDASGRPDGARVSQLRRLAIGADVIRTSRKLDAHAAQEFMNRLRSDPSVKRIEIDRRLKPAFTPNDPMYANQWHYFEAAGGVNLPSAWNLSTGAGVVVGVIDTGITAHSDLAANILPGYDFIADPDTSQDGDSLRDADASDPGDWAPAATCDPADPITNSSWHGTHVIGTVAAVTNNSKGVAGIAYNAKVVPLRVLGRCGGYTSDIADAIVWSIGGAVGGLPINPNPVDVINMSLGGPGNCGATLQQAINAAVSAGTVVVVASGNEGADAGGYEPASCQNVVVVGASNRAGGRATTYSNYGTVVDISAPGGEGSNYIRSTFNTGTSLPGAEAYAGYQGTSMATPHVAGVAALVQSVATVSPASMEGILKSTARALSTACPEGCGTGIVDATAAIAAAGNGALTINDQYLSEGNGGTKLFTFTVQLSKAMAVPVTFDISTSSGTATEGSDYEGLVQYRQSIPAGVTSKTYSIAVNGDAAIEPTETFFVNVDNVVGIAVADGQGQGGIVNDDALVLRNGTPLNGIAGSQGSAQYYSLVVPAGKTTLSFTTSGPAGSMDADLYVKLGSLPTTTVADKASFSSTTTETCTFDAPQAGTYYVLVDAYTAINSIVLTGTYSPSAVPTISVGNLNIAEGNSGTSVANFTATLSEVMDKAVTFNVATANGTATAGSDYTAVNLSQQTIPAGSLTKTIPVTISGDTTAEGNETFQVNLSNVSGAVLSGQGTGTIQNDDGAVVGPTPSLITGKDPATAQATTRKAGTPRRNGADAPRKDASRP